MEKANVYPLGATFICVLYEELIDDEYHGHHYNHKEKEVIKDNAISK